MKSQMHPHPLKAMWSIAFNDMRLLSRDRPAFFLAVLWPMILAVFFGALAPGFSSPKVLEFAVVNEGQGPSAQSLIESLHDSPRLAPRKLSKKEALARFEQGSLAAALFFEEESPTFLSSSKQPLPAEMIHHAVMEHIVQQKAPHLLKRQKNADTKFLNDHQTPLL